MPTHIWILGSNGFRYFVLRDFVDSGIFYSKFRRIIVSLLLRDRIQWKPVYNTCLHFPRWFTQLFLLAKVSERKNSVNIWSNLNRHWRHSIFIFPCVPLTRSQMFYNCFYWHIKMMKSSLTPCILHWKSQAKAPITNTQTPIQNAAAFLEIEKEGINYF